MSLPPYEPDGSLPALPAEEVTAKVLVDRYEVSKQTLYTRLSAIGVTGTKRGKQVFFNQSEVYQLDAAHYFLSKGYGLKDLKVHLFRLIVIQLKLVLDLLLLSIPMSQNWLLHLNKKE